MRSAIFPITAELAMMTKYVKTIFQKISVSITSGNQIRASITPLRTTVVMINRKRDQVGSFAKLLKMLMGAKIGNFLYRDKGIIL